jgi:hypothetical protein
MCGLALSGAGARPESRILDELKGQPVSQLDWGIYRLEAHLNAALQRDLINGEPITPPPQVSVRFSSEERQLTIEVGRTLLQAATGEIRDQCRGYVEQVRHLLELDKLGRPFDPKKGDNSALADKFFTSRYGGDEMSAEAKRELDQATAVQVLITVPVTGDYAVCRAGLRDEQIDFF